MSRREPNEPARSARGRQTEADRQARLAAELRANLHKRKDQARSRAGRAKGTPDAVGNSPPDDPVENSAENPPGAGEA